MRIRHRLSPVLVVITSCAVSLDLPDDTQVSCSSDAECPEGRVCATQLGQCVSRDADLTLPGLVAGSFAATPARVSESRTVTITFSVSKELARSPDATVVWGPAATDRRAATLESSSDGTYTFSYDVNGDESSDTVEETFAGLSINLLDSDGIAATVEQARAFAFDFKPPSAIAGSVSVAVTPAADNILTQLPDAQVTTLRAGSRYTVWFAMSEPLADAPTVATTDPAVLSFEQVNQAGNLFTHRLEVLSTAADGVYTVVVTAEDVAGNVGTPELPLPAPGLVIDTSAPAPPDLETPGRVVHHRAPWGTSSDTSTEMTVSGQAGASAACVEEECPWVLVLDSPDVPSAGVLGGQRVQTDGSFGTIPLVLSDRPRVFVAIVDLAGNASDADLSTEGAQAGAVLDGTWTATLGRKESGSVFENPHRLERVSAVEELVDLPDATISEASTTDYADASTLDGSDVRHVWKPSWSTPRAVAPGGRTTRAAYDSARGKVVIFGGSNGGSTINELWEWNGLSWSERTPSDGPASRIVHGLTYDAGRERIVLFGGNESFEGGAAYYLADTWEWDGARWTERYLPEGPSGRRGPSLGYDYVSGTVLMFGGQRGSQDSCSVDVNGFCGDTWGYAQWGTQICGNSEPCWLELTPSDPGDSPLARREAEMAFDPISGRLILFGGRPGTSNGADCGGSGFYCADTWAWNGSIWEPVTTNDAPDPRVAFGFATDFGGGAILLLGGWGASGCGGGASSQCADAWTYSDADGWQTTSFGDDPLPRSTMGLAFDGARRQMVMFGGSSPGGCPWDNTNLCRDTQLLESDTWVERARIGGIINHGGAEQTIYHPPSGRVLSLINDAFSNSSQLDCASVTDDRCLQTWERVIGGWSKVPGTTSDAHPIPRWQGAAVYDAARGTFFVYGGRRQPPTPGVPTLKPCNVAGSLVCSDTWFYGDIGCTALDMCWKNDRGPSPGQRYGHAMAYHEGTQAIWMFGGLNGSDSPQADTWSFGEWGSCRTAPCWINFTSAVDGAPSRRWGHAMGYEPEGDRVILFGGGDGSGQDSGLLDDTWELGPFGTTICGGSQYCWRRLDTSGPTPRRHASMVLDTTRNRLVLYGGQPAAGDNSCRLSADPRSDGCSDLWELDGDRWSPIEVVGALPMGRHGAALVSLPTRELLVFGGIVADRDSAGRSTEHILGMGDGQVPGLMATFDWTSSAVPTAAITTLSINAVAGGIGSDETGSIAGAQLVPYRARWGAFLRDVNWSNGAGTPPANLSATLDEPATWLDGSGRLRFFVVPKAGLGSFAATPEIRLDQVDVVVGYRQQ